MRCFIAGSVNKSIFERFDLSNKRLSLIDFFGESIEKIGGIATRQGLIQGRLCIIQRLFKQGVLLNRILCVIKLLLQYRTGGHGVVHVGNENVQRFIRTVIGNMVLELTQQRSGVVQ